MKDIREADLRPAGEQDQRDFYVLSPADEKNHNAIIKMGNSGRGANLQ